VETARRPESSSAHAKKKREIRFGKRTTDNFIEDKKKTIRLFKQARGNHRKIVAPIQKKGQGQA